MDWEDRKRMACERARSKRKWEQDVSLVVVLWK